MKDEVSDCEIVLMTLLVIVIALSFWRVSALELEKRQLQSLVQEYKQKGR